MPRNILERIAEHWLKHLSVVRHKSVRSCRIKTLFSPNMNLTPLEVEFTQVRAAVPLSMMM